MAVKQEEVEGKVGLSPLWAGGSGSPQAEARSRWLSAHADGCNLRCSVCNWKPEGGLKSNELVATCIWASMDLPLRGGGKG
jgi:hypothetical protein